MNEQIEKLARQYFCSDRYGPYNEWSRSEHYEFEPDELEDFVKCIVKECSEQVISIGRYNTRSGITPDLAFAIAVGLKKHFGVEE